MGHKWRTEIRCTAWRPPKTGQPWLATTWKWVPEDQCPEAPFRALAWAAHLQEHAKSYRVPRKPISLTDLSEQFTAWLLKLSFTVLDLITHISNSSFSLVWATSKSASQPCRVVRSADWAVALIESIPDCIWACAKGDAKAELSGLGKVSCRGSLPDGFDLSCNETSKPAHSTLSKLGQTISYWPFFFYVLQGLCLV